MIEELCRKYDIKNYSINPDGSIDVDGDVYLNQRELTELPLKFNKVGRHFYCNDNQLTSLVGFPKKVGGSFICSSNKLTSLEHCPKEVGKYFYCVNNQITDLTGLDKFGSKFTCNNNPIGSIFDAVEQDFTYAFQVYQVINGLEINLKRLKYVMQLWNIPINLEEIEKYYKIV